jgi:hypothetical protein
MVGIPMMADPSDALAAIQRKRENLEWITSSLPTLRSEYADRYVAVLDRKVVDADADYEALLKRIQRLSGSTAITIEYVSAVAALWML